MQNKPKEFGLIQMGKSAQKKPKLAPVNVMNRLSCFGESDDSDDEGAGPSGGVDMRYQSSNAMKLAKTKIDLAMEEDPNVFQYDEIYDNMKKDDRPKSVVSFDFEKVLFDTNYFLIDQRRKETKIHDQSIKVCTKT